MSLIEQGYAARAVCTLLLGRSEIRHGPPDGRWSRRGRVSRIKPQITMSSVYADMLPRIRLDHGRLFVEIAAAHDGSTVRGDVIFAGVGSTGR